MMGALDAIRGRDENARLARTVVGIEDVQSAEQSSAARTIDGAAPAQTSNTIDAKHAGVAASAADNTSTSLPVYAANGSNTSEPSYGISGLDDDSKEVECNPDHVTSQAGLGQQKAEAAALVWSRPVVILVYAW